MPALEHADYQLILEAVRRLYEPCDLADFPGRINGLVPTIVAADRTGYTELNPDRQRAIALLDTPEGNAIMLEHLEGFERHMSSHPLIRHFQEHPLAPPAKITDFLTPRQWVKTALYREFYQYLGLRHLMVVHVPAPQPLMVGVALGRGGRDFTEVERLRLNALRPHLAQSYRNAMLLTDLRAAAADTAAAFDALSMGLVAIDENTLVHRCSDSARGLLERYCGRIVSGGDGLPKLPPLVRDWARRQIDALDRCTGSASPAARVPPEGKGAFAASDRRATVLAGDDRGDAAPVPMTLPGTGGQLLLRLITLDREETARFLIHLAERPAALPDRLQPMGLTRREAEVLLRITRGLTNPRSPTSSTSAARPSTATSTPSIESSASATASWPPSSPPNGWRDDRTRQPVFAVVAAATTSSKSHTPDRFRRASRCQWE